MGWTELVYSVLTCGILLGSPVGSSRVTSRTCFHPVRSDGSIYDYTLPDLLETRNTSYNQANFEILGFPCNQFGMQEPGGNGTEILHGVQYVRPGNNFIPNFTLFKKIDVNGEHEHPVYTFLKRYCPPTRESFSDQKKLFYSPMNNRDIRWNFEKFLVNRHGKPVMRYDPSTEPKDIAQDIEYLLMNDK